jgi:hypothetical protein
LALDVQTTLLEGRRHAGPERAIENHKPECFGLLRDIPDHDRQVLGAIAIEITSGDVWLVIRYADPWASVTAPHIGDVVWARTILRDSEPEMRILSEPVIEDGPVAPGQSVTGAERHWK